MVRRGRDAPGAPAGIVLLARAGRAGNILFGVGRLGGLLDAGAVAGVTRADGVGDMP